MTAEQEIAELEELLSSIHLYISWYQVTRHLTTEQRERFADAVDKVSMRRQEANGDRVPRPVAPRWWRDDYCLHCLSIMQGRPDDPGTHVFS